MKPEGPHRPVHVLDCIDEIRKILESALKARENLRTKIAQETPRDVLQRKVLALFTDAEGKLGEQLSSLGEMVSQLEEYLEVENGTEQRHKGERS